MRNSRLIRTLIIFGIILSFTYVSKVASAAQCTVSYMTKSEYTNLTTADDDEDSVVIFYNVKEIWKILAHYDEKRLKVLPYRKESDDGSIIVIDNCDDEEIPSAEKVRYGCKMLDGMAMPAYLPGAALKELISQCGTVELPNSDKEVKLIKFNHDMMIKLYKPLKLDGPPSKELWLNYCNYDEYQNCESPPEIRFIAGITTTDGDDRKFAFENEICDGKCAVEIGSRVHMSNAIFTYFALTKQAPYCQPELYDDIMVNIDVAGDNNVLENVQVRYAYDTHSILVEGNNNTFKEIAVEFSCGMKIGEGTTGNKITEIDYFNNPTNPSTEKLVSVEDGANGFPKGIVKRPNLSVYPITSVAQNGNNTKVTLANGDEKSFRQIEEEEAACSKELYLAESGYGDCSGTKESPKCYLIEVKLPGDGVFDHVELYEARDKNIIVDQVDMITQFLGCAKYNENTKVARAVVKYPFKIDESPNPKHDFFVAMVVKEDGSSSEFSAFVPVYNFVDSDGDGLPLHCEEARGKSDEYPDPNWFVKNIDVSTCLFKDAWPESYTSEDSDKDGIPKWCEDMLSGKILELEERLENYGINVSLEADDDKKGDDASFSTVGLKNTLTGDTWPDYSQDDPWEGAFDYTMNNLECFWDLDQDGVDDLEDRCPEDMDPTNSDWNDDGIGDWCQDSDGDGYLDGEELASQVNGGLVILGDSLYATEFIHGLSSDSIDSDGDRLADDVEVEIGLKPDQADSDCDGVNDGDEFKIPEDVIVEDWKTLYYDYNTDCGGAFEKHVVIEYCDSQDNPGEQWKCDLDYTMTCYRNIPGATNPYCNEDVYGAECEGGVAVEKMYCNVVEDLADDGADNDNGSGSGDIDGGDGSDTGNNDTGGDEPGGTNKNTTECPAGQTADDEGNCVSDNPDDDPTEDNTDDFDYGDTEDDDTTYTQSECEGMAGYVMNDLGICVRADGVDANSDGDESSDGDGGSGGCGLKKKSDGKVGCSLTGGGNYLDSFIPYLLFFGLALIRRRMALKIE